MGGPWEPQSPVNTGTVVSGATGHLSAVPGSGDRGSQGLEVSPLEAHLPPAGEALVVADPMGLSDQLLSFRCPQSSGLGLGQEEQEGAEGTARGLGSRPWDGAGVREKTQWEKDTWNQPGPCGTFLGTDTPSGPHLLFVEKL